MCGPAHHMFREAGCGLGGDRLVVGDVDRRSTAECSSNHFQRACLPGTSAGLNNQVFLAAGRLDDGGLLRGWFHTFKLYGCCLALFGCNTSGPVVSVG